MIERLGFVALVLLFSFLLKRAGLFKEEDAIPFINYIIYFALPSLVFLKIRETDVSTEFGGVVILAWLSIGSMLLISFLVGKFVLKLDSRSLRAFILVSSFGNTAYMGYPFTYAIFGEGALRYAVIYDQLGSFLMVSTAGFLIASGKFSLRNLLLFPPFIALSLSLLTKDGYVPELLLKVMEIASDSLVPTVLFALGLRFSLSDFVSNIREVGFALFLKMLVAPSLVLTILKFVDLFDVPYRVALLESAMPPMVMASVLAIKYNLKDSIASSAVTIGIPISFFTAPLFLKLL